MSAAATTPIPTDEPNPAAQDSHGPASRILALVRKLIDYGKELAATFQRSGTTTNPIPDTCRFGISDIRLILARITQGLHRARALEERLVRNPDRVETELRASSAPSPRQPRATPPAAAPTDAAAPDPVQLPTPEQIAAQVRRRPVGAVIADICRDLGIMPNHPLWRELSEVIIRYGGNLAALYKDVNDRAFRPLASWCPAATPPAPPATFPPLAAPAGTGPPSP
jgi:hypothetical protein